MFMAHGGLLVVLLMVYVWGKLVTGPNVKPVTPGPTPAPELVPAEGDPHGRRH
jgi:hypothetical protein